MICTERLPRLLALALPLLVRLARAEVCPAGSPSSGCAAAAAAASEEAGAAVELVQVAASPRHLGPARLLAAETLRDVPVRQVNKSVEPSLEEGFQGIWQCAMSWYSGGKYVTMRGTDVKMHSQCEGMKAHLEGGSIHITEPELARGTVCNITDGMMFCSNGDNCTKLDFPMEKLTASEDRAKYLGRWMSLDGTEEGDAFKIHEFETGEFFLQAKDNISGFFHLEEDGFWQADLCQNKILLGGAMRFKLSKSKRMLSVNYYLPQTGWADWQPAVLHKHPEEKSFPFLVVAIPLVVLIFGIPASCFFFNMEGKNGHHGHDEEEDEKNFKAQDLSVGLAQDAPLEASDDSQRR